MSVEFSRVPPQPDQQQKVRLRSQRGCLRHSSASGALPLQPPLRGVQAAHSTAPDPGLSASAP